MDGIRIEKDLVAWGESMRVLSASLGFLTASFLLTVSCEKKTDKHKLPAAKVDVAVAASSDVPVYLEGIGHVRAYNHAEIKGRVEGVLFEVHYQQGELVKAGEPLMTIDPRPFEAQLMEAQGDLKKYESDFAFANDKAIRYSNLVGEDYVSQLNFDEYVSNVEALKGLVEKTKGEVKRANLNLEYCQVRAPFTGRVGRRLVDIGNLIVNDGSTLVTLNQIQPIYVDFSLPEKDFLKIQKKQDQNSLKVKIKVEDIQDYPELGELVVIGNDINKQTGMIPLRAQFENKDEKLWNGQFVKAKLILEVHNNAVLIPQRAISLGQKGSYVYVIENNVAKRVDVVSGERYGDLIEINSGIKPGDIVVTSGQISLKEGREVSIKKKETDILEEWKVL